MIETWESRPDLADGSRPRRQLCPICGDSDRVERASSVVRQGTGFLYLRNSASPQPFVSELARDLSPPEPPDPMSISSAITGTVVSWIVAALFVLLFEGLRIQDFVSIPESPLDTGTIVTLVWFGIILPVILFARVYFEGRSARRELPRWQLARQRWFDLYYCVRDDIVFGEAGEPEPPERTRDLLYRVAPSS
jgi:hypothetical protein